MDAQRPARQSTSFSRWFWGACVLLWLVFGAVLWVDPSRLLDLWHTVRDWPLIVQALTWIALLPWMVGLWIWQLDWWSWLRVALIVVVAVGGAIVFFPRRRRRA
ncbi:MAG TPA: hypothetical protein VMU89_19050 [Thermomicrobiaceae bacterium]|nr:hypothetical protein [Thermomicrobiaceae bacterium]